MKNKSFFNASKYKNNLFKLLYKKFRMILSKVLLIKCFRLIYNKELILNNYKNNYIV